MGEYRAVVVWSRDGAVFTDNRYSRAHRWLFDGGVEVPASSSPQVVPLPLSVAAAVDPEEAFVASLSSCHMLWRQQPLEAHAMTDLRSVPGWVTGGIRPYGANDSQSQSCGISVS